MDVTKKQVNHIDPLKQFNAPLQPFHARGRFELVAGCMRGEEGKGLVKKKGATDQGVNYIFNYNLCMC